MEKRQAKSTLAYVHAGRQGAPGNIAEAKKAKLDTLKCGLLRLHWETPTGGCTVNFDGGIRSFSQRTSA